MPPAGLVKEAGQSPRRLVQAHCLRLSHFLPASPFPAGVLHNPPSLPSTPAGLSPGQTYQHLSVLSAYAPGSPLPLDRNLLAEPFCLRPLDPPPGPGGTCQVTLPTVQTAPQPSHHLESAETWGLTPQSPQVANHLPRLLSSPFSYKRRSRGSSFFLFHPPPHPTHLSSHQPSLTLSSSSVHT